jgi:hypothetical protein
MVTLINVHDICNMANEIVVGAERTLGFGDVYPLPSEDAPNRLVKRLKLEWNRVKDRGPSSWYLVRRSLYRCLSLVSNSSLLSTLARVRRPHIIRHIIFSWGKTCNCIPDNPKSPCISSHSSLNEYELELDQPDRSSRSGASWGFNTRSGSSRSSSADSPSSCNRSSLRISSRSRPTKRRACGTGWDWSGAVSLRDW